MGNNDADSCVPTVVTDFIFDLSDSVTLSQIPEEQTKLYATTFRDLCSKYFSSSPWPSPQAIASECNGHPLFLAIYREVTHRHWHSVSRPTARDRVEGWSVYRELLEELLDEENVTATRPPFFLSADWCFDILHEFVYQFQGYCQFRTTVTATAQKHNVNLDGTSTSGPHHLLENVRELAHAQDAWAVESVMEYLHRLMDVAKSSTVPGYQYLGIFSSIALSRLECLLGDYSACLTAADRMTNVVVSSSLEGTTASFTDVVHSVPGARVSLAYHKGVAYFMLRRYQCCISTLAEGATFLQRQSRGSNQKVLDRMVALLAMVTHIVPPKNTTLDDALSKLVREKHGPALSKMSLDSSNTGVSGYQDLFSFCSPKFITPTAGEENNVYKLQMVRFQKHMMTLQQSRKLRSFMKLYTSLDIKKLAAFHNDETATEEDFEALLISYKHLMHQEEFDAGIFKSALDIHYHLNDRTVFVDEAEKQRRFENYFMRQIGQDADIRKVVQSIQSFSTMA